MVGLLGVASTFPGGQGCPYTRLNLYMGVHCVNKTKPTWRIRQQQDICKSKSSGRTFKG